jgi:hypothetical protein
MLPNTDEQFWARAVIMIASVSVTDNERYNVDVYVSGRYI